MLGIARDLDSDVPHRPLRHDIAQVAAIGQDEDARSRTYVMVELLQHQATQPAPPHDKELLRRSRDRRELGEAVVSTGLIPVYLIDASSSATTMSMSSSAMTVSIWVEDALAVRAKDAHGGAFFEREQRVAVRVPDQFRFLVEIDLVAFEVQ